MTRINPDHAPYVDSDGWNVPIPLQDQPARPIPALNEPARRPPAQVLTTYRTNLEWAMDCAALKMNRLKPGSSAWKTQGGVVRGLREALQLLISEGDSAT